MPESILDVSGLWAAYGATPILQGVDMAVRRGEIVGVIGRNGAGKTTLMRCLIGLIRATRGSVRLFDRDITDLPPDARARAGMGYIPQGRDVFPQMTVEENLEVGKLIGGPNTRKLPDLVYTYFPQLKERWRQIAGTMSGGEQQQLAIGRALIGNPVLMLLDEPSEGVQPSIVQMICEALQPAVGNWVCRGARFEQVRKSLAGGCPIRRFERRVTISPFTVSTSSSKAE